MDRGAWWAAVHGVAKSRARLNLTQGSPMSGSMEKLSSTKPVACARKIGDCWYNCFPMEWLFLFFFFTAFKIFFYACFWKFITLLGAILCLLCFGWASLTNESVFSIQFGKFSAIISSNIFPQFSLWNCSFYMLHHLPCLTGSKIVHFSLNFVLFVLQVTLTSMNGFIILFNLLFFSLLFLFLFKITHCSVVNL